MLPRSTFQLTLAVVVLATLTGLLVTSRPTAIHAQNAAEFEGQGPVTLTGIVDNLRVQADGSLRFQLVEGSIAVDVRTSGPAAIHEGNWASVAGRVMRNAGALTLWADPDGITNQEPAAIATPSWREIADRPNDWVGRPLRLSGEIARGALRDHDGHALAVENGAWPTGPAEVTGFLKYAPSCVCYVLSPLA